MYPAWEAGWDFGIAACTYRRQQTIEGRSGNRSSGLLKGCGNPHGDRRDRPVVALHFGP